MNTRRSFLVTLMGALGVAVTRKPEAPAPEVTVRKSSHIHTESCDFIYGDWEDTPIMVIDPYTLSIAGRK